MEASALATKIREYESFLNDVLKEDLKKAQKHKAEVQHELKEYEDLEANLKGIKEAALQRMTLHVDLGSEVLMEAHVPDKSHVYLSIGLGFHVATTLDDAPRVIGLKKETLKKRIQTALDQVAKIRAHIRMTEETLAELQKV